MIPVKIKDNKYGQAIGMLLRMGAGFQTRYKHTLIVTMEQKRALEEAGFVATNGRGTKARKTRGAKAK